MRATSMELDTIPATDSQVLGSMKGSPNSASPGSVHASDGKGGTPCPVSPSSSVPSSAGKDEAIWFQFMNLSKLFRLGVYVLSKIVLRTNDALICSAFNLILAGSMVWILTCVNSSKPDSIFVDVEGTKFPNMI